MGGQAQWAAGAAGRSGRPAGGVSTCATGGQKGEGLFDSDIVQKEFFSIVNDFEQLSKLLSKFPEFDLGGECCLWQASTGRRSSLPAPATATQGYIRLAAGKRIFLEKMDSLASQLKTFTFRMKLSNDSLGRSVLDGLNQQMANAGTDMNSMYEPESWPLCPWPLAPSPFGPHPSPPSPPLLRRYEGLARQTDMMRAAIAVEERIADPEELRAFRAKVAAQMSPVTNLNMSPEILDDPDVMRGLSDPKVGAALAVGPPLLAWQHWVWLVGPRG